MKGASGAMPLMIQSSAEPTSRTRMSGTNRPSPCRLNILIVRSAIRGMTTRPVYQLRLCGILPDHRSAQHEHVHVRSGEHGHGLDRGRHDRIPARVEGGVEQRLQAETLTEGHQELVKLRIVLRVADLRARGSVDVQCRGEAGMCFLTDRRSILHPAMVALTSR